MHKKSLETQVRLQSDKLRAFIFCQSTNSSNVQNCIRKADYFTVAYSVCQHYSTCKREPSLQQSLYVTVELHWLEQAWDHEKMFQPRVVLAIQGKFLYKVTSGDPRKEF